MNLLSPLDTARLPAIDGYEPLYRRVPKHDRDGRLLSDFMMLIPGLREWPRLRLIDAVAGMQAVLGRVPEVEFADLNLRLNLLWVSVQARPGVIAELAALLVERIPEARLVSGYSPPR